MVLYGIDTDTCEGNCIHTFDWYDDDDDDDKNTDNVDYFSLINKLYP